MTDDSVISAETFSYDAAGNITDAPDSCFAYDTNNRLTAFMGEAVTYDPDGNMLWNGELACTYDSANRLITAGGHTYTYNAESVRIRNLCADADTTYTYNTNCKLSQLLVKTTNGIVTKYVYGRGLIGEEKQNCGFKTYHFDYRGSTVAIADESGNITDTFKYDTYGKLIDRTGTSFVIFGYNGRDGVITDKNGLIYMRARYYSPDMRRFVNADIVAGDISNAVTLNRFAYANGNPVSFVDPFGLDPLEETMEDGDQNPTDDHEHFGIGGGGVGGISDSSASNGVSTSTFNIKWSVDEIRGKLQKIADAVNSRIPGRGPVVGTAKHSAFATEVKALDNRYIGVEQSYIGGKPTDYGHKGSIRFDVVVYDDSNKVIAAFDLKTGSATLTAGRIQRMQMMSGLTTIPISAIH